MKHRLQSREKWALKGLYGPQQNRRSSGRLFLISRRMEPDDQDRVCVSIFRPDLTIDPASGIHSLSLYPLADPSPRRKALYQPPKISTHCPQCAGALDFAEGSNAIQCKYCGSALLVTGYARTLSYFLAPAMKEEEVRGAALRYLASQGRKDRIRQMHLAFVPYYRLSGLDFCWTWREKTISSPLLERCPETNASLLFGPSQSDGLDRSDDSRLPPLKEKEYGLSASHLDRSFLAADLPTFTLHSLSVRPQVLTLRLFDPEEIGQIGSIIPVSMDTGEAWDRIGKDFTPEKVTRRGIINRTLSLIFFPIWEVRLEPDERVGSLLFDAVGRTFLQETPSPFWSGSWREADFPAQTLRFRPLSCPNCASGLPVEPSYRIFSCSACHRVWRIQGDEFADLPYRLAMPPAKTDKTDEKKTRYLPFWIFLGQVCLEGRQIRSKYDLNQIAPMARLPQEADRGIPLRFFIPAFKLRDLSVANRLATSFTRMQPPVDTREPSGEPLHPGAVLDAEEAAAFSQITLVSIAPKANPRRMEAVAGAEISLSPGELVFFPFREQGNSLQEDFLGTAIQLNTLQ